MREGVTGFAVVVGPGTVRLERLLPGASDGDVIDAATGWHAHVDILEDRVSGRTPRLFWATHERLEEDYRRRLPPQLAF
jgi:hypothetical protein